MERQSGGPEAAQSRRVVGGYELLRAIGSGGMGTVYEALDGEGNHVALKLLHPAISADPAARARLRREVSTLHRVRGARVARVLDAEADSVDAFVVTELVDGETLDDSIQRHGPMTPEEVRDLAAGLAAALQGIHAVGVLHRDLKPGNVMLTDDGPVLIDFGISQVVDDARLTQTGLVTGTPGYVDPAVLAGATPSTAGDWWGWAALLVFASTGRPPFGTGSLGTVLTRAETHRVDLDGVAPSLGRWLHAALHPAPHARLPHRSVLASIERLADGGSETELMDQTHRAGSRLPLPPSFQPGGASSDPRSEPQGAPSAVPAMMMTPVAQVPRQQPSRAPDAPPVPSRAVDTGAPAVPPPARYTPPVLPEVAQRPRWATPPRPRRAVPYAWGAAIVATGMLWPGIAISVLVVVMVFAGALGAGAQALRLKRIRRGSRRSDTVASALASPWHLLKGLLLALPGLGVGALGSGIVWVLLAPEGQTPLLLLAVMAPLTLLTWWTPSSRSAREGTWLALDYATPSAGATWVWAVGGLAVATICAAAAMSLGQPPVWAPLPVPPIPSFGT